MSDKQASTSSQKNAWKVWVDRDLCIGAASCIAVAPKAFSLDDDAKAVILDTIDQEQKETVLDAARACPVAAIFIEETKTGKRIFPK
ncbi:MAG: ferredoxin [Candidatus Roizmanbacteria bacterium]|nr:ferredoxin [Candidatus Roizmanbacteria bacterium]